MQSALADVRLVYRADNYLGESPVWCPRTGSLYWINCQPDPCLFRMHERSGEVRRWPMPERIGAVILCADGGLVVALAKGLHRFDVDSGELHLLALSPDADSVYLHEGKCDRQGRLWIGSLTHAMMLRGETGGGNFYRLDGNRLVPAITDISVSNGLAWSPDGATLYCTDTPRNVIWAYDYDTATGTVSNRRDFAIIEKVDGRPDGAAVDAEGGYWTTLFQGGCLRRYTADGAIDREIKLPFANPTMLAFGGDNLDRIYVTTTRHRMSSAELAATPEIGGVFCLDSAIRGLPEPVYRG